MSDPTNDQVATYWQTMRNNRDAVASLKTLEEEIFAVACLFTRTWGDSIVKLTPKGQSLHVRRARGALKAMRAFVESSKDNLDEEGKLHFSRRKLAVVELYSAYVKACLALAFVDYWKGTRGFTNFAVLAHQVEYYANAVLGENWELYAAPVFFRPTEALLPITEESLHSLTGYSVAAHGYAMALHGQLSVLSRGERLAFKPVELTAEERQQEAAINCEVNTEVAEQFSQAQAVKLHFNRVQDWLTTEGRPVPPTVGPVRRLIGVKKVRGKASDRKNKRMKHKS